MGDHDCKDAEACWAWWTDLWVESGDQPPPYNAVVANELFDYHAIINGLTVLYDNITGGEITIPTTLVREVIRVVDDRMLDERQDGYDEGYNNGYSDGEYEALNREL